jgi:ribosome-associated protein
MMEFEDHEAEHRPSRSERKREAEVLQKLGEALVALPPDHLKKIPLPIELAEAIRLAQRITAHGGRRRQLQLIGKLMRQIEDPQLIRTALDRIENRNTAATVSHHLAEHWRDRLIAEGDAALADFLAEYPNTKHRHLRQLIQAAQHEQASGKPPKSSRELFRFVLSVVGSK